MPGIPALNCLMIALYYGATFGCHLPVHHEMSMAVSARDTAGRLIFLESTVSAVKACSWSEVKLMMQCRQQASDQLLAAPLGPCAA